jgi:hypothetical protein
MPGTLSHVAGLVRRHGVTAVALFVALAGTSYAASGAIRRGSVAASSVANGAISSTKVKDGSLQRADLAPGVLRGGPAGQRGAAGPRGRPGSDGPAGAAGTGGAAGPPGAQGTSGPAGEAGLTGPAGTTGQAGPRGPAGDTGDDSPLARSFFATLNKDDHTTLREFTDFKIGAYCGGRFAPVQVTLVRKTSFSFDGFFGAGDNDTVAFQMTNDVIGAARNPGAPSDSATLIDTISNNSRAVAVVTIWSPTGVYGLHVTAVTQDDQCRFNGLLMQAAE